MRKGKGEPAEMIISGKFIVGSMRAALQLTMENQVTEAVD